MYAPLKRCSAVLLPWALLVLLCEEADAERVWEVAGDCEVDSADHDCVMSSNYPAASEINSSCTLTLLGRRYLVAETRVLKTTHFEWAGNDDDGTPRFGTGNLSHGDVENSTVADQRLFSNEHENIMIYWQQLVADQDDYGWRICGRTHSLFHSGEVHPIHAFTEKHLAKDGVYLLLQLSSLVAACLGLAFLVSHWTYGSKLRQAPSKGNPVEDDVV